MKFTSLLLACLPAAALAESLAYKPPAALAKRAKERPEICMLPHSYHIKDFKPHNVRNNTDSPSFKFTYVNPATNVTTKCHYHAGSTKPKVTGVGTSAPQYPCKAKTVSFMWSREKSKLTMIQKICPESYNKYNYAAAGSVFVSIACSAKECLTRQSDYKAPFTTIRPVNDTSIAEKKHRGNPPYPLV